ncbi:MAG: DinB family protein [Nitrososphaerota archaeon]|nr:DinB family protein [Nitrososphaerota archaeon]
MGRLETVRRLWEFDQRTFTAFERSIERWGWKPATENHEIGHLTMKDTLVHVLNATEAWLVAAAQDRWEVFDAPKRRPKDILSFRELRDYRDRVWGSITPMTRGLTDKALERRVKVPWMPGRYTLEDGYFQATFEQAHHLGEIIGVYWQHDRTPPQMMWVPTLLGTKVSVR